jgi:hypothetical protein
MGSQSTSVRIGMTAESVRQPGLKADVATAWTVREVTGPRPMSWLCLRVGRAGPCREIGLSAPGWGCLR